MEIVRNAINCKVEISLNWSKNCILSSEDGNSVFAMTDTKLYVPIVTLSAESNVKLSTLLGEGFKRSIYWNKYKVIANKHIMQMEPLENYLIPVIRKLKDYLLLLMIMLMESNLILTTDTFFHELK